MPDVSASFCITKDLEVTFFTLNFSPNKLKIHGEEFDGILWVRCHHYLGCLWRKLVCSELGESCNFCRPFTCFFSIAPDERIFFFHFDCVTKKASNFNISYKYTCLCIYIYIFFTQYKFHISKWSFRRWICLFQVCKATRNPSPLPWGSPSWPRGNGPGAVSGTQQFPVVFLLTSHGKTFRLFFFSGKKERPTFFGFFFGFRYFWFGGWGGGWVGLLIKLQNSGVEWMLRGREKVPEKCHFSWQRPPPAHPVQK